jgi:NTP pyrophosphatase (non-canonical NTP hydrolase)
MIEPVCNVCDATTGKRWWQDVPGLGDLCDGCHELHVQGKPAAVDAAPMTPVQSAREVFGGYAALDAPRLPSDLANPNTGERDAVWLSDLQVELARWQVRNFGVVSHEQQALGVAEEAGELSHAVLKHAQRIRGMDDVEAYREKAGDAIADVVIYAMQMATALRLDFATLVEGTARNVMQRDWTR